jgi:hypothetical protein
MSRKRNWQKYNRQLIQRGSLSFLIDPKLLGLSKKGKLGRPKVFSDTVISALFMIKIFFRLPYRALQGFAQLIKPLVNIIEQIPDYTSICRRAKRLQLPKLSNRRPQIVAIDSSGVKVCGEGEWKVKIHGKSKRRKWLKVHVCMDPVSGEIIAETTTTHTIHDGESLGVLLPKTPKSVKTVLGDGIFDGQRYRERIKRHGAKALVSAPRHARITHRDPDRDEAVKLIRGLGKDTNARSLWGKLTGYSQRALVENTFSRMKRMFGASLFSKKFDNQIVENHYRCLLLNKMNTRAC